MLYDTRSSGYAVDGFDNSGTLSADPPRFNFRRLSGTIDENPTRA